MKKIASQIRDIEFDTHIDDMQLTLFRTNKLTNPQREEVLEHLVHCKRCRDVLRVAKEIDNQEPKPANNIDYIGRLKGFIPLVAGLIIFIGVPKLIPIDEPSFKSGVVQQNIIEESLEYWQKIYYKIFGK